jgi:hypothetical protein
MSTPQEHIEAQRRLWSWFSHGSLPASRWPKHMISATELEHLYADAEKWREHQENERRKLEERIT